MRDPLEHGPDLVCEDAAAEQTLFGAYSTPQLHYCNRSAVWTGFIGALLGLPGRIRLLRELTTGHENLRKNQGHDKLTT